MAMLRQGNARTVWKAQLHTMHLKNANHRFDLFLFGFVQTNPPRLKLICELNLYLHKIRSS